MGDDMTIFRQRDHALYWLVRLFIAQDREGWEEGPTEEEVREKVLSALDNTCIGPYLFPDSLREFLADQETHGDLTQVGLIGDIEELKRRTDNHFTGGES